MSAGLGDLLYFSPPFGPLNAADPSQTIDDNDITCQIPTTTALGSTIIIPYFTTLIQLAKLTAATAKMLSSVQTFRQNPESLAHAVATLGDELALLKQSAEPFLQLESASIPAHPPNGMTLQQLAILRCTYYNVALDIHTALTYPWYANLFSPSSDHTIRNQVERSSQTVVKTCRDAIFLTQHIQLDASTPGMYVKSNYAMLGLHDH